MALKQSNQDHFDKQADAYDQKAYIRDWAVKVAERIVQTLPHNPEESVWLDVGCGTGLLSELLAPHVRTMIGVDPAEKMVDVFNRKAADKGLSNMRGLVLDVADRQQVKQLAATGQLPGSFQACFCHMTLHHIDDVSDVIKAMAELLSPGGRLVLTDLQRAEATLRFHNKSAHHTVAHLGGFTVDEMQQHMQQAGLVDVVVQPEAFSVGKPCECEGGGLETLHFPLFMAIGQKSK